MKIRALLLALILGLFAFSAPFESNSEAADGVIVNSVSPSSGPQAGGTPITIFGSGFVSGATVTIGGATCISVIVNSQNSISCTTPIGNFGYSQVVVTNLDSGSDHADSGFRYISSPSISGVSPTSGSSSGGTTITISGTDFHDAASVTIGGEPCTLVASPSIDSMTCITGMGSTGVNDIVVTNQDGGTTSLVGGFLYLSAPTLSEITPSSGPLIGDTTITIAGNDFYAGASVTIDGEVCTSVSVVTVNSITCNTPFGSAGAKDLQVTNRDGGSVTSVKGFTYISEPSFTTPLSISDGFAVVSKSKTDNPRVVSTDSQSLTFKAINDQGIPFTEVVSVNLGSLQINFGPKSSKWTSTFSTFNVHGLSAGQSARITVTYTEGLNEPITVLIDGTATPTHDFLQPTYDFSPAITSTGTSILETSSVIAKANEPCNDNLPTTSSSSFQILDHLNTDHGNYLLWSNSCGVFTFDFLSKKNLDGNWSTTPLSDPGGPLTPTQSNTQPKLGFASSSEPAIFWVDNLNQINVLHILPSGLVAETGYDISSQVCGGLDSFELVNSTTKTIGAIFQSYGSASCRGTYFASYMTDWKIPILLNPSQQPRIPYVVDNKGDTYFCSEVQSEPTLDGALSIVRLSDGNWSTVFHEIVPAFGASATIPFCAHMRLNSMGSAFAFLQNITCHTNSDGWGCGSTDQISYVREVDGTWTSSGLQTLTNQGLIACPNCQDVTFFSQSGDDVDQNLITTEYVLRNDQWVTNTLPTIRNLGDEFNTYPFAFWTEPSGIDYSLASYNFGQDITVRSDIYKDLTYPVNESLSTQLLNVFNKAEETRDRLANIQSNISLALPSFISIVTDSNGSVLVETSLRANQPALLPAVAVSIQSITSSSVSIDFSPTENARSYRLKISSGDSAQSIENFQPGQVVSGLNSSTKYSFDLIADGDGLLSISNYTYGTFTTLDAPSQRNNSLATPTPPTPPTPPAPSTPSTPPTPPTPQKNIGSGLISGGTTSSQGKVTAKASKNLSQAVNVQAPQGKSFTPVLQSLPAKSAVAATIKVSGKNISLGTFKVDARGFLTLPTLTAAKPGIYVIQVTDSSGKNYFIKIAIGKKK